MTDLEDLQALFPDLDEETRAKYAKAIMAAGFRRVVSVPSPTPRADPRIERVRQLIDEADALPPGTLIFAVDVSRRLLQALAIHSTD